MIGDFLKFYWAVVMAAFTHSIEWAHAIVFVLLIALGAASTYLPTLRLPYLGWKVSPDHLHAWQGAALVFGAIIIIRLILAPFWVWQKEHQALVSAGLGDAETVLKHRWQPLSAREITSLRSKIRNLRPPPEMIVMCNDAGCFDLQQSFLSAFEGLGWNERPDQRLDEPPKGIGIFTAHAEYQELANAIEAATNGRLKVQFHHRQTGNLAMDNEVHLAIGRKP
jgi:hypothetical protein